MRLHLPSAIARPKGVALRDPTPDELDKLICMGEITATDAARRFADLLDAVEHRGDRFTIVRRGRVVARLEPVGHGRGATVKAALRRHLPDHEWPDDLVRSRDLLRLEDRA